jgi:hypothetical protein
MLYKTIFYSMKQFYSFALLLLLSGCVQDHVQPPADLTIGLTGIYTLSYIDPGNNTGPLPNDKFSGEIEVRKNTLTSVVLTLRFNIANTSGTRNIQYGDYVLQPIPNQPNHYTMFQSGNKQGTISPNEVTIDYYATSIGEFRGKR